MEIQLINDELLSEFHGKASENERLRINFDLRTTPDDGSQRMLNVLEQGTKVPIHRHLKSSESVICIEGHLDWVFYVGVRDVERAVVIVWFAVNYVFLALDDALLNPLYSLEPNEFDAALLICETRHEALLASLAFCTEIGNDALQLHINGVGTDVGGKIKFAFIDVFVRKIIRQIAKRTDAKFFLEALGALWAHAREIHYRSVEYV
jgi:cupin fold WbuC family metalloprotein